MMTHDFDRLMKEARAEELASVLELLRAVERGRKEMPAFTSELEGEPSLNWALLESVARRRTSLEALEAGVHRAGRLGLVPWLIAVALIVPAILYWLNGWAAGQLVRADGWRTLGVLMVFVVVVTLSSMTLSLAFSRIFRATPRERLAEAQRLSGASLFRRDARLLQLSLMIVALACGLYWCAVVLVPRVDIRVTPLSMQFAVERAMADLAKDELRTAKLPGKIEQWPVSEGDETALARAALHTLLEKNLSIVAVRDGCVYNGQAALRSAAVGGRALRVTVDHDSSDLLLYYASAKGPIARLDDRAADRLVRTSCDVYLSTRTAIEPPADTVLSRLFSSW
jgi:hypothetical protein